MKKFILFILLGILIGSCATAPTANVQKSLIEDGNIKIGMKYNDLLQALGGAGSVYHFYPLYKDKNFKHMFASPTYYGYYFDTNFYSFEHTDSTIKRSFWSGIDINGYRLTKIWDDYVSMIDYYISISNQEDRIHLTKTKSRALEYIQKNNTKTLTTDTSTDIDFTIDDKRDQCEAIGFKPETEKFADCVLKLVELDVKTQNQNKLALAQNSGNEALVKQLQRQSDIQSSQALIDLGQELMNPKRYNSNIYMPQTQRCTMQGFGTFATMRCR